jgi:hypothetical protein
MEDVDMFCPQCGTKIDNDSKFCSVCGAAQTSDTQEKQTVMEVCQILRTGKLIRRTGIIARYERGDVWLEARIGSRVICQSDIIHDVIGSSTADSGWTGELSLEQDKTLRQQVVDKLRADGWRPSGYDDFRNVTAMDREKA